MSYEQVYDNARWQNIPLGVSAMFYRDGRYAAPLTAARGMARARWITVFANYRACGAVDLLEQPWYSRGLLRGYVRGRRGLNARARLYTDQAQAAEAVAALRDDNYGELLAYSGLYWWIATLDGIQRTPEELANDLATRWNAPEITADRIWANQWLAGANGASDQSDLFLPW